MYRTEKEQRGAVGRSVAHHCTCGTRRRSRSDSKTRRFSELFLLRWRNSNRVWFFSHTRRYARGSRRDPCLRLGVSFFFVFPATAGLAASSGTSSLARNANSARLHPIPHRPSAQHGDMLHSCGVGCWLWRSERGRERLLARWCVYLLAHAVRIKKQASKQ